MANPNIVSISSLYGGNAGWNLSNTLTATLLTVDAEKLVKINRITCANVDGSAAADLNLYIDGFQHQYTISSHIYSYNIYYVKLII